MKSVLHNVSNLAAKSVAALWVPGAEDGSGTIATKKHVVVVYYIKICPIRTIYLTCFHIWNTIIRKRSTST